MKQTATFISTYTGDTSGVASALYELGGMTVMHDASGCNSTYNTHDEPRWYDKDSLVFISGLAEIDAVTGNDEKLIADTVKTAKELHPRFIALAGTPIPMMTGTDLTAVAREIERRSGVPSFGFDTDGMHTYVRGASAALEAFVRRFLSEKPKTAALTVNLLGTTPLDFSVGGMLSGMKEAFETRGIRVLTGFSYDCDFESALAMPAASVNVVVSSCGLAAAKAMRERFGIPYVVGAPFGEKLADSLALAVREAAADGVSRSVFVPCEDEGTLIVGEGVTALSLAAALALETARPVPKVAVATDLCGLELPEGAVCATDEDELIPHFQKARRIIADPLYRPLCPDGAAFIENAHEAFSGRLFRRKVPDLAHDLAAFIQQNHLA